MRKFRRAAEPAFLASNWETWGEKWANRKAVDSGAKFTWRQLGDEPVNRKLLPTLKAQTQDHCSFCDNFPVSPPSLETVEHFRPKSKFHREAYHWLNLYFCCAFCQQKGEDFDEALLRPDAEEFDFDRYFRWDHTTGRLEINETATPEDQNRARVTLELYRLNEGHPSLRKREQRRRSKLMDESLDDFAYRGFIE